MKYNNILTLLIFSNFIIISLKAKTNASVNHKIINSTSYNNKKSDNNQKKIYKDQVFRSNIKTVLCHKKGDKLSLPLINLSSDEQLTISFDDLDADRKDYSYTITHCNSDWTESNLIQNEYINGFTDESINNYEFSFNTIQKYTYYQFDFPSTNIKPIISGNYIFKIYEKDGDTIIYKRFMILDTKLYIDANVRRATLAENRNTKHEVDFAIKHPKIVIADPFADIKVHIKQNNRQDNSITNLTPQFVRNDELVYNYEDINTFFGNNEFRHFDFKSLRYQSERIKSIYFDSTYNHVYLFNDNIRLFDQYSIKPDINGAFIIESQEGWQSSIEADYAFVHFTLPMRNISYGDLYLLGAFSNWEINEDFKLKYNIEKSQYEGDVYLKQGYYNYHYALNDTITNRIDVSLIEGTFYQTRNDYYIYVYYRETGGRYDRLIGFLKTSSKELF